MRPRSLAGAAALWVAVPSFPEALGIWVVETLQMGAWLLVCGVIFLAHLFVVYGTMYALSKLAGRIRGGPHSQR